jgi:DnaJ domain
MQSESFDPYAVLGVTPAATQAEITHAYRAQLRALHPDTRQAPAPAHGTSDTQLARVLAAYAQLRQPARRADDAPPATPPDRHPPAETGHPRKTSGPVQIPVNHVGRRAHNPADRRPPLWVGPVRRHR